MTYTIDTLKKDNITFQLEYGINETDVETVNTLVDLIENSRSHTLPQIGDKVRYTNKYGSIPDAHVKKVEANKLYGCERSLTPVVYQNGSTISISLDNSLPFEAPITEVKYIGKENRTFKTWGHCGVAGHGMLYFEAEVSIWEYVEPK